MNQHLFKTLVLDRAGRPRKHSNDCDLASHPMARSAAGHRSRAHALPRLLIFVAGAAGILAIMAACDANEPTANVALALKSNAEALSGLEITGYYERELLGNAAESLKQLHTPEPEAEFCQRVSFRSRLDGNRVHQQTKYPPSKFTSPNSVNERSFDGKTLYSGTANPSSESRGVLMIHTPLTLIEDEKRFRNWGPIYDFTYLHAAGFDGLQNSSQLGQALYSRVLDLVSHGELIASSSARRDGKAVEVLELRYPEPWMSRSRTEIETDPNFQFVGESQKIQRTLEKERRTLEGATRTARVTLDPAMNYAVVGMAEYRGDSGELMFDAVNSDFIDMGQGLWLPRTCAIDGYAFALHPKFNSKAALYRTNIKIEKIERAKFSEKDFQVWFDVPGLSVSDFTHATAKPGRPYTYRVPVNVEQLGVSRGRYFWLGINLAVFIVLALLVAWRVKQKRKGHA